MKRKLIFISLLIFVLLGCSIFLTNKSSYVFAKKQLHFVFISPTGPKNMFWNKYTDYMKDAAKDLKIKLDVYYTYDNPYKVPEILDQIIKSSDKPDVVMFINYRGLGKDFIKKTNEAKINTFLVNAGLSKEEQKIAGKPREKYKYWIGEMYPDDEYAGYILAKTLINTAKEKNKGTIHVLGIKGPKGADEASDQRVAGLKRALKEYKNVVLDQIVAGHWAKDQAEQKFKILKTTRYKDISVVWTACDGMALGVIDGVKTLNLRPGQDIFTGGVDWLDEAFVAIKNGEMTVSVGGHFMEGAWVIVALHDYFSGVDFKTENVSLKTQMIPTTLKDVDAYKNKTDVKNLKNIDFSKYSKKLNPEIKKYEFIL